MTDSYVFESPHVAALMDVGQARLVLEAEAKEKGSYRFGQGYHDFTGGQPLTREAIGVSLPLIISSDPEAWSSILRAALLVAQGSENHPDLKRNVKHLAVLSLAWYEDLEARNVVGLEP